MMSGVVVPRHKAKVLKLVQANAFVPLQTPHILHAGVTDPIGTQIGSTDEHIVPKGHWLGGVTGTPLKKRVLLWLSNRLARTYHLHKL